MFIAVTIEGVFFFFYRKHFDRKKRKNSFTFPICEWVFDFYKKSFVLILKEYDAMQCERILSLSILCLNKNTHGMCARFHVKIEANFFYFFSSFFRIIFIIFRHRDDSFSANNVVAILFFVFVDFLFVNKNRFQLFVYRMHI